VNTLGDRVEDVFLITGAALTDSRAVLNLEQDLLKGLSLQQSAPVAAVG
jgi:UTP:GlnB (protein PII) uridylyltransferase